MRCTQCDYPLWNLPTRVCPECGQPFAPSQFQFMPNSVRFCCPHCDQAYYGTDEKGLLVPREFECVNCHQGIAMDQMVLREAVGVREEQTILHQVPWEKRRQHGWVKSWWRTVVKGMVEPAVIGAALDPEKPATGAWAFAIVTNAIVWFCGISLLFAGMGVILMASGDSEGLFMLLLGLALPLLSIPVTFIGVGLWALITHGVLVMGGKTRGGLGLTCQCLCYAQGPMIITAIPLLGPYCGQYFSMIWSIVSGCVIVHKAQRVGGLRATVAVLLGPVLMVATVIALYMIMLFSIMGGIATAARTTSTPGTITMSGQTQAQLLRDRLLAHPTFANGSFPGHPLTMMSGGGVQPWDFLSSDSSTSLDGVMIGQFTLAQVSQMSTAERQAFLTQLQQSQPPGVIAHRVGDFVFTHYGMIASQPPPELWLVIGCGDPAWNGIGDMFIVTGSGSGRLIPSSMVPLELSDQNAARAAHGLPPLPDPRWIAQDQPVLAPAASEAPASLPD